MSSKIKIDKNIPVPGRPRGDVSHTIEQMELGDSVMIQLKELGAWRAAMERRGFKPISRKINESEYRIWKMERDV
jgi:hypothetical protein